MALCFCAPFFKYGGSVYCSQKMYTSHAPHSPLMQISKGIV